MRRKETKKSAQPISPIGPIGLISLIGLIGLIGLTACSGDGASERDRLTVEVVPCAQSFFEVSPIELSREAASQAEPTRKSAAWPADGTACATRAWTPPGSYKLYSELNNQFDEQTSLIDNTIDIFFTRNGEEPEEGLFLKASTGNWRSSVDLEAGNTYYLYGIIPFTDNADAAIAPPTGKNYSDGAVLTLRGMPSITPSDVCVVVGAKNGIDEDNDNGLTTGQFACSATSSGSFIYLLFDHIYSAMRLRMMVDEEYNALRTIRLKELKLVAYTSDGTSLVKKKTDIVITLGKTDNGSSPIESITFTPDGTSEDVDEPLYTTPEDGDGLLLTTTATNFLGSFVPQGITKFEVTSSYDVYDKDTSRNPNGNLIRQNCTATNTLDISDIFHLQERTEKGWMYSITMVVAPTYLYVLSDPDLDSPTVRFE